MIDLNLIRSNPDFVREALRRRAMNSSVVDDVLTLDVKRRTIVTEVEGIKSRAKPSFKGNWETKRSRSATVKNYCHA